MTFRLETAFLLLDSSSQSSIAAFCLLLSYFFFYVFCESAIASTMNLALSQSVFSPPIYYLTHLNFSMLYPQMHWLLVFSCIKLCRNQSVDDVKSHTEAFARLILWVLSPFDFLLMMLISRLVLQLFLLFTYCCLAANACSSDTSGIDPSDLLALTELKLQLTSPDMETLRSVLVVWAGVAEGEPVLDDSKSTIFWDRSLRSLSRLWIYLAEIVVILPFCEDQDANSLFDGIIPSPNSLGDFSRGILDRLVPFAIMFTRWCTVFFFPALSLTYFCPLLPSPGHDLIFIFR